MDDICAIIQVDKKFAKSVFDALRKNSLDSKDFRVSPIPGLDTDLYVPFKNDKQTEVEQLIPQILGENFQKDHNYVVFCPPAQLIKSKSQPRSTGIEQIRSILRG